MKEETKAIKERSRILEKQKWEAIYSRGRVYKKTCIACNKDMFNVFYSKQLCMRQECLTERRKKKNIK